MGTAPRRAVGVVLGCLLTLLAGCTVGPSQRPPVAVRGENLPAPLPASSTPPPDSLPPPQEQNAAVPFVRCTEDVLATLPTPIPPDRTLRVDCGAITLPAEPGQVGRRSLGVLRVGLADAPEARPPLLALGDSATEPSARHAVVLAGQVAPTLLERYTLVGLDRRGSGADMLDCAPAAALVDADPDAVTEAELTMLLEQARTVVQECPLTLDGGLVTYRTAAAAADVDQLRAALGVDRLSAIGVGDGAAALAEWARLAPQSVGRLVLDGLPDPAVDEPERSVARAASTEAAFNAFAVACTAQGGCPLGADPRATVTGLVEVLRPQPLVAADGRRLTAGVAVAALLTALGEPRGWPALAAALATAGAGDPAPLLDVLNPVLGTRGRLAGMLATTCSDARRRLAPADIAELAARWHIMYPLAGGAAARRLMACGPWPTGGSVAATGNAAGAPPFLVIGTAADPRSPLEESRRAADALDPARFLTWQGAGTGAYPRTPCVRGVVDAMLVDGIVPQPGMLCPP